MRPGRVAAGGPDPSRSRHWRFYRTHTGCTESPPGFAPVRFVLSADAPSRWSAETTGTKKEGDAVIRTVTTGSHVYFPQAGRLTSRLISHCS